MGHGSVLFEPLDRVLGRLSQVRVLRALTLHGGGLTPPELARRTRLSRRGVWNALETLEGLEIVEPVGPGHSVPYRLSRTHPIARSIRRLFEDETERADGVLAAARSAAAGLEPSPLAVWLFGSVGRAEDQAGSDLDLAVVADRRETARESAAQLRDALHGMEEQWGVYPSVISLSSSELETLREEGGDFWRRLVRDGIPLLGPAPEELSRAKG